MHTTHILAHFNTVTRRPCCDKCIGLDGDDEGNNVVDILDYYDEKKAAFEKQIAELEAARKKLDAALYLYPPVKQSIVQQAEATEEKGRLWFAQVRAVLDEKEKQWKVNLKQREAAKLAQMNAELERLTWDSQSPPECRNSCQRSMVQC